MIAALLLVACGSDPSGTALPTRSYHMGFSAFPPRPDTNLDLAASPPPPGSVLPLFAHPGLVDSALGPKPALAVWDSLLALDRRE